MSLGCAALIVKLRANRVIHSASPLFCLIICAGCACLSLAVILWPLPQSGGSCFAKVNSILFCFKLSS